MDMTTPANELRDAAELARQSAVTGQAVALARWIGTDRRPVTAGQVLRKADVPAAGAALGVEVPAKLRTMADLRTLYRPWSFAVATGLLQVGGGWASAGPGLEHWPPADADLLAAWLAGLRAVCTAESYPQDEDSVRLLAMALLTVLGEDGVPCTCHISVPMHSAVYDLCNRYDKSEWEALQAAYRYHDPGTGMLYVGLLALLGEFGAVVRSSGKTVITPLGRWAARELAADLPGPADPDLSASEMLAEAARFSDEEQRHHVARGWLAERQPAEAAREILTAAEGMSPLMRGIAVAVVDRLGKEALPVWRELTAAPRVGPHAREVLAAWDEGPESTDADWNWLAVEAAAAALQDQGPDEALSRVWESMPGTNLDTCLAEMRATDHPDAVELIRELAEFVASGAPRSLDQVAELKVSLAGWQPPIWRRIRMPVIATLADLHRVIQVLFGWDGDHLHLFQVGKKQYSDPFMNLEQAGNEDTVRVRDVLKPGEQIEYTYDFGADWEHKIAMERIVAREPGQGYPVCLAHKGDSPVEYWSEEDPEEPEPFNLAEVNRKLGTLGGQGE